MPPRVTGVTVDSARRIHVSSEPRSYASAPAYPSVWVVLDERGGPIYEWSVPPELRGTCALVQVTVTDVLANATTRSATLGLWPLARAHRKAARQQSHAHPF